MKYRDLLKAYKTGEVTDEVKRQIEEDIEKQEAISDYLVDEMEDSWTLEEKTLVSESSDDSMTEMINASIHKAFRKMGTIVLIIALAVVLFVSFGLSPIVSAFFYNPAKKIYEDKDGNITNRMSYDLGTYTELTIPGHYRNQVNVTSTGFGKYNFDIPQSITSQQTFVNVGGNLNRGKIEFYNANVLRKPSPNFFAAYDLAGDGTVEERMAKEAKKMNLKENEEPCFWYYSSKKYAREELTKLDNNKYYFAYVTLDRNLNFKEMQRLLKKYQDYDIEWLAVKSGEYTPNVVGYGLRASNMEWYSSNEQWKMKGYPNINIYEGEKDDGTSNSIADVHLQDEKWTKQHMVSLLNYMADQIKFLKLFEDQPENYRDAANYIKKHGLTYYGFCLRGTKAELLKMEQESDVYGIVAELAE